MVWDCGAGHFFFSGFSCLHLIGIFPFLLVTAKFIGKKKKIGEIPVNSFLVYTMPEGKTL